MSNFQTLIQDHVSQGQLPDSNDLIQVTSYAHVKTLNLFVFICALNAIWFGFTQIESLPHLPQNV